MGLRLESEGERTKFLDIGVEFSSCARTPNGGILVNIDLPEADLRWQDIELLVAGRRTLNCVASTFSAADLDAAKFVRIQAKSGGYPQPEDVKGYLSATYDLSEYCARCGVGKKQAAPFRLKSSLALRNNSILQLNWVPDEFFVTHDTWEALFKPLGIGMRPAVAHRTGAEITSVVQLDVPQVYELALEGGSYSDCHFCGRKKYSPVFKGFLPEPISPDALIFKSSQSFGTGAQAYQLVILSAALYARLMKAGLRGAEFYACGGSQ